MCFLFRKDCIAAMRTGNKRQVSPESDIWGTIALSKIISVMVEQRHHLGTSQRELAEMCSVPHSTFARIKAGRIVPNMGTHLKICARLYLTVKTEPIRAKKSQYNDFMIHCAMGWYNNRDRGEESMTL